MKAFALLLGAAVSLGSVSAFAGDPKEAQIEKEVQGDQKPMKAKKYWSSRSTGAADEAAPASSVLTKKQKAEADLAKKAARQGRTNKAVR
ncbi:MAG: hypothetical protein IPJ65_39625 [Archangiaceae bacterium]|nr:hypothetical protein [Archangiaceae bacterium]